VAIGLPQQIRRSVRRDHLVGVQQQRGQEAALLRRTEDDMLAAAKHLQRPEEPKLIRRRLLHESTMAHRWV
jgi:hypothetical protein